jgi:uncharacterized protein (TIGR03435 family)
MSPRTVCAALTLSGFLAVRPSAQQPPAQPLAFDVASIKIAPPLEPQKILSGQMRMGPRIDPARAEFNSMTLADLVNYAFNVRSHQVVGPSWLSSSMNADRFDVQATLPAGATTDQVREMLQTLLADRFNLKYHREDRDQDVYALIVGKGGPKLKEAPPEPPPADPSTASSAVNDKGTVQITGNGQSGVTVRGGGMGAVKMTMGSDGTMHLEAERMTMAALCDSLTRLVDRPVVDKTDLKGVYSVALELSMADIMHMAQSAGVAVPPMAIGGGGGAAGAPATAASEPGGLSVLRSVETLGLKLDPRKMAVAKIVIDRLEKMPTAN